MNNKTIAINLQADNIRITKADLRFRNLSANTPIAESNAASRIYPFANNVSVIEDLTNERHNKPYTSIRKILPNLCKELGLDPSDMIYVWRQNCGCRCGCSPGFKVMGSATPKFDLYLQYEYVN